MGGRKEADNEEHGKEGTKELLPDQQTRDEGSEDWDDYGLSREGGKGRPRADCEKLLIIVIYSYMINIYSSRKIRQSCKENINYLWVLGGNKAPSHTTIRLLCSLIQRRTKTRHS